MKLVQRKRCLPIVGEYQVVPGPARLRVAGAACGAHLAVVRVGMARLAISTQADKSGVHESASVFRDTMALVAFQAGVMPVNRTSPVFWHFVTGQALHLVLSAVHGVQV